MMTQNVLWRTFFIKGAEYGTGFTIDVNGRQYFVTANHLLCVEEGESKLKIYANSAGEDVTAKVVGINPNADIAVLEMPQKLTPYDNIPLEPTDDGLMLGQDVYVVGFPQRWSDLGKGRRFPLIRKGTFSSGFNSHEDPRVLWIDVINNAGFSGGLVVFQPGEKRSERFRVAGVVTGYLTAHAQVLDREGCATGCTVETNTGFLIAHDIRYAVEMIHDSATGNRCSS